MKFLEKIRQKAKDNYAEGVCIAFLGDSVTHGCFEIYKTPDGLDGIYDRNGSYVQCFANMMEKLFPSVPLHIINAGIGGDNARIGATRVERDVLRYQPDLVVVCYGLNDCAEFERYIPRYVNALSEIFDKIRASGCDVIFMTPNMMNTEISPHLTEPSFIETAKMTAQRQNSGMFDKHLDAAKALCREKGVPVCDCYAVWKMLDRGGVNVTELLCNQINHPCREMHRVFAYELIKTIFSLEASESHE